MKRTINIGDKHKAIIDEYESIYDKEEFNMLITKLLLANKSLKDKNIDILVIADLIDRYNIDFFALMNSLSSCRDSGQVKFVNQNEIVNSPIVAANNQKTIVEKKEITKEIDLSDKKKEKKTLEVHKDGVNNEKVVNQEKVVVDEGFNNNLFTSVVTNEKPKEKPEEKVQKINPILALNIDLR